jgi:RNA-dependent RNA polymerase
MLLLKEDEDPEYDSTQPRVYLRPSQIKIKYDPADDSRHRPIVEVIRYSKHKRSANVVPDTIVDLAHNGVHPSVFCRLMEEGLMAIFNILTEYDSREGLLELWRAVQKTGNVMSQRIARILGGAARAMGYVQEDQDADDEESDDEEDEDEDKEHLERSLAWYWDKISGCPSSLEETVMVMLDSGFDPNTKSVVSSSFSE